MSTRSDNENALARQTELIESDAVVLPRIRHESIQARGALHRMSNARCSALAKLPPEILSMIFEAACAVKWGLEKLVIPQDGLSLWQDRGCYQPDLFLLEAGGAGDTIPMEQPNHTRKRGITVISRARPVAYTNRLRASGRGPAEYPFLIPSP